MEIGNPGEFLNYFNKVHQRTMNVVRVIPPDRVDWQFRKDKNQPRYDGCRCLI
jgi:hypothetical protein